MEISMPPGYTKMLLQLPIEVVEKIIANLPLDELSNVELVHSLIHKIIRSPNLYSLKYDKQTFQKIQRHLNNHVDSYAVHYSYLKHKFLWKNLLKNPDATEDLKHWTILSGDERCDGSSGWKTQDNNFVTDSFSCSKIQKIDLWKLGLTPKVMRALGKFKFIWGERVTSPAPSFYEMQLRFYDANENDFLESAHSENFTISKTCRQNESLKIEKQFKVDTGKQIYEIIAKEFRYVSFYHGGMSMGDTGGISISKCYFQVEF